MTKLSSLPQRNKKNKKKLKRLMKKKFLVNYFYHCIVYTVVMNCMRSLSFMKTFLKLKYKISCIVKIFFIL